MQLKKENLLVDRAELVAKVMASSAIIQYIDGLLAYMDKEDALSLDDVKRMTGADSVEVVDKAA